MKTPDPVVEEGETIPETEESVSDTKKNGGTAEKITSDTEIKEGVISGDDEGAAEAGSISAVKENDYQELNERYLRLMAEYDNYRKRSIREKGELIKTASENLIIELLPILDNLDRATEHRKSTTTLEEYVKGIAIIEEQFRAVLAKVGLEPLDAVGKPFDPAIHDAVMQIESEHHDPGTVITEAEKGYVLSGKVIRHPKVIVSK